ncbi:putative GH3 family protein [Helianthus annuus]|nr:putative GH3 family protein [Helianthus annuus]
MPLPLTNIYTPPYLQFSLYKHHLLISSLPTTTIPPLSLSKTSLSLSTSPSYAIMPEAPNDGGIVEKNKKTLQFIEDVTSNPDEVQQRILTEILTQNATVEYLHRHGLSSRTDRESFKKLIPVVTYEDLHNDIIRIANGDKSPIFSSRPISEFLTRYHFFYMINHSVPIKIKMV